MLRASDKALPSGEPLMDVGTDPLSEESNFRISVVAMTGATIAIDDAAATDSILSVKERVFAQNRKFYVHRQRLMYRPGPRGMQPLADDETLGGAGVAQDGAAELDVLLAELTAAEVAELGHVVGSRKGRTFGHNARPARRRRQHRHCG